MRMRRRRILGDATIPNVYHVYSRIINRESRLGLSEREGFERLVNAHARMAGVEVLAFAIMPNHFHLLVRVPDRVRAELEVDDRVILERLSAVYSGESVERVHAKLDHLRAVGERSAYHAFRRQFLDRMHDLSVFVKEVKARFTMGYNRANNRSGPLWEDRFRSVLLQGDDPSLVLVVATYIDLNAVRAGLVADPKDYRHCSYGAALGGDRSAAEAIGRLLGLEIGAAPARREALAQYRLLLFSRALPSSGTVSGGAKRRGGVPVERVRKVFDSGGHLPALELLRCRVRYLTNGLALGSHAFLEALFPGRAKRPRKADLGDLAVLCEVRGEAVSPGAEMAQVGEA